MMTDFAAVEVAVFRLDQENNVLTPITPTEREEVQHLLRSIAVRVSLMNGKSYIFALANTASEQPLQFPPALPTKKDGKDKIQLALVDRAVWGKPIPLRKLYFGARDSNVKHAMLADFASVYPKLINETEITSHQLIDYLLQLSLKNLIHPKFQFKNIGIHTEEIMWGVVIQLLRPDLYHQWLDTTVSTKSKVNHTRRKLIHDMVRYLLGSEAEKI